MTPSVFKEKLCTALDKQQNIYATYVKPVNWGNVVLTCLLTLAYLGLLGNMAFALAELPHLSLGWHIALMTATIYWVFTVMHEASHENIFAGTPKLNRLENPLGWLASLTFIIMPFSLFKVVHLIHHAHTNDPENDPDHFMAGPVWLAVFKGLILPLSYLHFFIKASVNGQVTILAVWQTVVYFIGLAFLGMFVAGLGIWDTILLYLLLPVFLASALLAFALDYLPHYPHQTQQAPEHSKNFNFFGAKWIFMGQNTHQVHHALPRIPWYRYDQHISDVTPSLKGNLKAYNEVESHISATQYHRKKTRDAGHTVDNIATTTIDTFTKETVVEDTTDHQVKIEINGAVCNIKVSAGETVLQAALAQQVRLPHACKKGLCGRCKIAVQGEHNMQNEDSPGLLPLEKDAGLSLACQCVPAGALHIKPIN